MRRAYAVIALGVLGVLLAVVPTAGAANFAEAGWWDRNNGAPVIGGVPPAAEGNLRVQYDPQGSSAVAAIRFQLDENESRPILTLAVVQTIGSAAGVLACRPEAGWSGKYGGPWAERPLADCDAGRAGGVISGDGATVTFDLAVIQNGRTVDLVIVPAPTAGNPVQDSFTMDFETPTSASLATSRQTTTTTTTTLPPFSAAPPTTQRPTFTTTTRAAATPVAPVTTQATTTTTSAPVVTEAPVVTQPDEQAAPTTTSDDDDSGSRRIFAFAIAAAIAGLGAYLWFAERGTPATTGGVLGGLGAFQKERLEAAPEVS